MHRPADQPGERSEAGPEPDRQPDAPDHDTEPKPKPEPLILTDPPPPGRDKRGSRKKSGYKPSIFVRRAMRQMDRMPYRKGARATFTLTSRWRKEEIDKIEELIREDQFASKRDLLARALDLYVNLTPQQRHCIRNYNVAERVGMFDPLPPRSPYGPGRPRNSEDRPPAPEGGRRKLPVHRYAPKPLGVLFPERMLPGAEEVEQLKREAESDET